MAGSQLLIRKRPNCTNYSQQKWWNSRPFWIINWRKETVSLSYRFIFAWPLKAEAQKANYSAPEETNETWPTGIAAIFFHGSTTNKSGKTNRNELLPWSIRWLTHEDNQSGDDCRWYVHWTANSRSALLSAAEDETISAGVTTKAVQQTWPSAGFVPEAGKFVKNGK